MNWNGTMTPVLRRFCLAIRSALLDLSIAAPINAVLCVSNKMPVDVVWTLTTRIVSPLPSSIYMAGGTFPIQQLSYSFLLFHFDFTHLFAFSSSPSLSLSTSKLTLIPSQPFNICLLRLCVISTTTTTLNPSQYPSWRIPSTSTARLT